MVEFTKEQIRLVSQVDCWAQENDKSTDRQFQGLYSGSEGWEGVAKNDPVCFGQALGMAINLQSKVRQ